MKHAKLPQSDLEEVSQSPDSAPVGWEENAQGDGLQHASTYDRGNYSYASRRPSRAKFVIAGVCALVLVGAGVAVAATSLGQGGAPQAPSEQPADEQLAKATERAFVKADGVLIPSGVAKRGDVLENVAPAADLSEKRADAYYRAEYDGKTVYVAKSAVRTSAEEAPEQWTGYATADAIIYARPDFTGDDILTLQLNEEVTVLDAFGDLLFVRNADGFEGYVPADKIMREPIEEEPAADYSSGGGSTSYQAPSSSGGGNSGGGSGNSGGSSSSAPSPAPAPSGGSGSSGGGTGATQGDGDEMAMPVGYVPPADPFLWGVGVAYADEPSSSQAEQAGEGLTAVVLMDDVQLYAGILDRGDEVTVKVDDLFGFSEEGAQDAPDASSDGEAASGTASDAQEAQPQGSGEEAELQGDASAEDLCTVVINDQEVTLPEKLLRLESAAAYEPWEGYALEGALLYADYGLTGDARELEVNEALNVVDSIGTTLVVDVDGTAFYIDEVHVGKEPVEVVEEPPAEEPAPAPVYSAPANTGGGSASGGGSSSSSTPAPAPSGSGGGAASGSDAGQSGGSAGSDDSAEWTAPKL
ncbi:hypothetical protein [Adlercreutzia sp. ZJ242]|uniref:hypothetical protein n=1 Tax=Adlercreutzia sp. ZJ242 TaxID=2709409 RepID=UPI0013EC7248|nr:hypothetical protein [Adlercreutzia sp. ZJ242]